MIILLSARQGLIGRLTSAIFGGKLVLASMPMGGPFLLIFTFHSRVITTIMAVAEKIDPSLEEAGRSLGASTLLVIMMGDA